MLLYFTGDRKNGELGLAALPNRQKEFKESIEQAITYAKALKCKRCVPILEKTSKLMTACCS